MSRIQEIIKSTGRHQKNLAPLIGVEESQISRLLSEPGKLTLDRLQIIADWLNCTISELTGETEFGGLPRAGARNLRSRRLLKQELENIDRLSIRAIREGLCAQGIAPENLQRMEEYAASLREELAVAV